MKDSRKPPPNATGLGQIAITTEAHGGKSEDNYMDFRTMLAEQESSVKNLGKTDKDTGKSNDEVPQVSEKLNQVQLSSTTGNESHGTVKANSLAREHAVQRPQKPVNKASLPNKFMNLRELNDKKVVGLKHYGMTKSTRNMRKHEWLSSNRTVQSNPALATTQESPEVVELKDIASGAIPSATNNSGMYVYPGQLGVPKGVNVESTPFVRPPKIPKSVEELEEKARRKATWNPFELLFLGNLAAFKVMGFYLITLETIISCGMVSQDHSDHFSSCIIRCKKKGFWDTHTHSHNGPLGRRLD